MRASSTKILLFLVSIADLVVYLVNTGSPLNRSDIFLGILVHTNNATNITLHSSVPIYLILMTSAILGFVAMGLRYLMNVKYFLIAVSSGFFAVAILLMTAETSWMVLMMTFFTQFYAVNITLRFLENRRSNEIWIIPLLLVSSNAAILLWNALDPFDACRLTLVCLWVAVLFAMFLSPFHAEVGLEPWIATHNASLFTFNVAMVGILLSSNCYYMHI